VGKHGIQRGRSRTGVQGQPAAGITPAGRAPQLSLRPLEAARRRWLVLAGALLVALVCGGVGLAVYLSARPAAEDARQGTARKRRPPATAEEKLCLDFADLKNADDPRAGDLLGPTPAVPVEPVSPAEARRLDAEFILRRPFRVTSVEPLVEPGARDASKPRRFVLVLQGGVASEPMLVQSGPGKEPERSQRVLSNPEVHVEVRDGKIYGLDAQLHID
jgi:hypothetical protein